MDKIDSVGGYFTNGIMTSEQLLQFSEIINNALKSAGYYNKVDLFLSDFGKVTINTSALLNEVGGYNVPRLPLSEIEKNGNE